MSKTVNNVSCLKHNTHTHTQRAPVMDDSFRHCAPSSGFPFRHLVANGASIYIFPPRVTRVVHFVSPPPMESCVCLMRHRHRRAYPASSRPRHTTRVFRTELLHIKSSSSIERIINYSILPVHIPPLLVISGAAPLQREPCQEGVSSVSRSVHKRAVSTTNTYETRSSCRYMVASASTRRPVRDISELSCSRAAIM